MQLRPLMIGGAGSDVGKSIIVTGLCRIFRQDGYNPAPFKAQNMALNSYVTPEGLELGRAQAVQAEAAGIECMSEMNPILLKPIGNSTSQVILNGKPMGNRTAKDYFNKEKRKFYADEIHKAYDRLAARYNPIVMEGAGSIAEINLRGLDLVNMPMAKYADAPVILVTDIRRGGVFACAYGSIMLQEPEDRKRIKGIIVNQFRGDIQLFKEGRKMLEEICGVPVLGVMPYLEDLHIEEEDSYFSKSKTAAATDGMVNVAITNLRHISNFTDFDPLECNPDINVYYTLNPEQLKSSDVIILPGTKATIADLAELYDNGVAATIIDEYKKGKPVIGICGGYQMLGRKISDPKGIEGDRSEIKGLGILPTVTTITEKKETKRVSFRCEGVSGLCHGYEIHMGHTQSDPGVKPFATYADGRTDGCVIDGKCIGTYIHGLFDNAGVVNKILSSVRDDARKRCFDYREHKNRQYDRLAQEMREHIDIDMIYKIMSER